MGPRVQRSAGRGQQRVAVKKASELVAQMEAIVLTEARWERGELDALRDLLAVQKELINAQGEVKAADPATWEERWDRFGDWLDSKAQVDHSAVRGALFGDEGGGLVAERDLREGERVLSIPRQMMITADLALRDRDLTILFQGDPILRRVESLALAVCVLKERILTESEFSSYLDILPTSFTTPLYFNTDEVLALRGSTTMQKSIARIRGNARQYCHLYHAIKAGGVGSIPPSQFTFALFRWAVSVVMTRQNMIPTPDGGSEVLALIPLWDMINHAQGSYTTQFDMESDSVEFFAMESVFKGKQVHMFYGPRPNSELLVHSGFVYEQNEHDCAEVPIDLDTSEELYRIRKMLLEKQGVKLIDVYESVPSVRVIGVVNTDGEPGPEMLAVARIRAMNKEDVTNALREGGSLSSNEKPSFLPEAVEEQARQWLLSQFVAQIAHYPREEEAGGRHSKMAHLLCSMEKRILQRAVDSFSSSVS